MSNQNSETGADAGWMTKSEALAALNKSERSLDRLVVARKIERRTRPRPNRPPEPIFNRADVEKLIAVDAYFVPAASEGRQVASRAVRPDPADAFLALAQAVLQRPAPAPATVAPMARWLPVKEAAAYLGLSVRMVRTLITGGFLPALRDGRILKVRREDLDALEVPREFREEPVRATRASDQTMARSNNGSGHAA